MHYIGWMLIFVCQYASPEAFGAPNPAAQRFELHNLAVIHKHIHFGTVVLDVPGKNLGIGGLKHQLFEPDFIYKFCWHLRSPRIGIFGNAFRFDHDHIGSGLDKTFSLFDGIAGIEGAFGFQLTFGRIAARAKLDTYFGFGLSPASCTFSISRSQSSVGSVMNPAESSMISKP